MNQELNYYLTIVSQNVEYQRIINALFMVF